MGTDHKEMTAHFTLSSSFFKEAPCTVSTDQGRETGWGGRGGDGRQAVRDARREAEGWPAIVDGRRWCSPHLVLTDGLYVWCCYGQILRRSLGAWLLVPRGFVPCKSL